MALFLGCDTCKHFDWGGPVCAAYPQLIPLDIISGDRIHTQIQPDQTGEVVYESLPGKEVAFTFENIDRYPDADLLEPKDYEQLGYFGDEWLILVGFEDSARLEPLVVRLDYQEPGEFPANLIGFNSLLAANPMDVSLFEQPTDQEPGESEYSW